MTLLTQPLSCVCVCVCGTSGVRQALQCSMVAPSRHFKYMDTCTSPLEKLYCLKETCDLIMKTVAASQPPGMFRCARE
jgi:hypothetical protein